MTDEKRIETRQKLYSPIVRRLVTLLQQDYSSLRNKISNLIMIAGRAKTKLVEEVFLIVEEVSEKVLQLFMAYTRAVEYV